MRASSTRTGGKITIFAAYADPFEPAGKRDHHVVSEKTGVRKMVEAAVLQIRPKAQQRGIRIEVGAEERPSAGRTPAGRTSVGRPSVGRSSGGFRREMEQEALYNLLDNAVKYTESGRLDRGVVGQNTSWFLRIDCDGSRNRDPRARDRAYFRKICPRRTGEKSGGRGDRSVPCGPDRDRGGRIFESEKHPR